MFLASLVKNKNERYSYAAQIKALVEIMYDCVVIGTGAAGVSAALTLKALNRNFVLIGKRSLSAKIFKAEKIKNYPGLPAVSGEGMRSAFISQLESERIEITEGKVTGVFAADGSYSIACNQEVYQTRTVILASGVETVKPIDGEKEFLGRGVSYCATCDGFLYRGKVIAAVVTSKEEEHEVDFLSEFAGKVYLFPIYKDVGKFAENVQIIKGKPLRVEGGEKVEKLVTSEGELAVDGVFMLKDTTAGDGLIKGLEVEGGSVKVDRACATNLTGVFAAGDCTGRPYQYAKAVGEGNVAAHSVNAYLNANKL